MKKFDLAFVILAPLFVLGIVFIFNININYLTNLFLVFGIPITYLGFKTKHKLKKISIFTFLVSIPLAIIIELIAMGDNAWYVPKSFFSFRILGNIPLEDFIWMFFVTAIILLFYEHFINKKPNKNYSKKGLRLMVIILYSLMFIVISLHFLATDLLQIPYAFFWTGFTLLLIPTVIYLLNYKKDFIDFSKTSAYAFVIFLIFELIGVSLNHWIFQGNNYLDWVNVFGIKFPFEEFFYVMLLGGFAALSYYNFFMNKFNKI